MRLGFEVSFKMGGQSKTHINISRLLAQCESMAAHAQHKERKVDWRLAKYVKYLKKQIDLLTSDENTKPDGDIIREYKRKVEFLEDIVQADKVENPLERTLVCQHLLPGTVVSSTTESSEEEFEKLKTASLHLQVKGKHHNDLRKELFGGHDNTSLRNRKGREDDTTKDIDDIIKHHHAMQEKAAEDMIQMAIAMKQNSLVASEIIKKDNVELERSSKVVEHNAKKLQTESERLEELNKRKCSWTIWIMLTVVSLVFLGMIVFVKLFRKRKP